MWLETITTRTAKLEALKAALPELLEQLASEAPELEVAVYTRYPGTNDLTLQLLHRSEPIKSSALGLQIAAAFNSYGTVDHALWQAVEA